MGICMTYQTAGRLCFIPDDDNDNEFIRKNILSTFQIQIFTFRFTAMNLQGQYNKLVIVLLLARG